jgi:hypothetical protein
MDHSELQQRVIGLATQIYYAHREGKDFDDPEIAPGIRTLIKDFDAYSAGKTIKFPQTEEEPQALINECTREAVAHATY